MVLLLVGLSCGTLVSYLVNTCGLSPQAAISAAKKVNFTTPDRPDLVLALLSDYGFDNTHIPKLISKLPVLLLIKPDKTLRPKLEFFRNLLRFSSPSQLPKFIVSSPFFLLFSFRQRIIPYCNFLKTILLDDSEVAVSLMRSWVLRTDLSRCLAANVEMLRRVGAPQAVILYALLNSPTMVSHKQDKFKAGVEDVIKLGFQPSQLLFIQALDATLSNSKPLWKHKIEVYKSWSWTDDEISLAFRKYPLCMKFAEEKISCGMDFLVNKMGFHTSSIAKSPITLGFSLEKRIIPRSTVYGIIQLKGLMEKEIRLSTLMKLPEKQFLRKFVTPYKEQVPQLLNVYEGKVGILDSGFGPEDLSRVSES